MKRYLIKKIQASSIIEHPPEQNGGIPNASLKPGIILSKSHDYLNIRPIALKFAKRRMYKNIYALFYVENMAWCDYFFTISLNSKGKKVIDYCRCCGVRGAFTHWNNAKELIYNHWKELNNLSYDDVLSIELD